MEPLHNGIFNRVWGWFTFLPVHIAFWLVWVAAKTGNEDAECVYTAMWEAELDLPKITRLTAMLEARKAQDA